MASTASYTTVEEDSFPLSTARDILDNPNCSDVYLMDPKWIKNWFVWALFHSSSSKQETLRLAALQLQVPLPSFNHSYTLPGPIDSTALSVEGHPLVLSPLVQVVSATPPKPPPPQRVQSLGSLQIEEEKKPPAKILAVAVPEVFYERLRSVHGVVCDDLEGVSFQAPRQSRILLYSSAAVNAPVEFRRKRISVKQDSVLEMETLNVETHPLKLTCPQGWVLVSRRARMADAIAAWQRILFPKISGECWRLWSKRNYNEMEWHCQELTQEQNMLEWVERHDTGHTVQVEWEFREPSASWERKTKYKVGDALDAQDVTGQWFEAIVTDTDPLQVHYLGWSSKWDAVLDGTRLPLPAPLWSLTDRWRQNLKVDQVVEIRDSKSKAARPRWYRGVVQELGTGHKIEGAELEMYQGKPLCLLERSKQVLVHVEEEDASRWVSVYGEEVCKLGTHLKQRPTPTLVTYDYERDRPPVEVLKSQHPRLGAGFLRESLRGVPPAPGCVGLHNLGNSCFLNTAIQCLNHIELLSQYFLQDDFMRDLNRANPLGSGGNVAQAYSHLLKSMWGGEYATLAPRRLKQTVAAFTPQFDNSYQHDTQEFCQFLMDGLHEDTNRVQTKPYVEELEGIGMKDAEAAQQSWQKHLLRHDSVIVDHCQGMHRSHLTCPRCGRESIKFDVYSSLSVPVVTDRKTQNSRVTLYDCLDQFMEGEQLDERNAWYCPKCRQHVCALKMIALWTAPDVLIIHLKRFTFTSVINSNSMLRSKIDDTIDFPIEGLDLSKYLLGPIDDNAKPIYSLLGVAEHQGPTANSGHYTATVRNSVNGQWYRCNDSHVGQTYGEAAITGGAYVLFYQRTTGSAKWGGMVRDGFVPVESKKNKKKKNKS